MVNYVIEEQDTVSVKKSHKYPMVVSEIFSTETPKLINLFFEKFEEKDNSSFASVDEENIPEEVITTEIIEKEDKNSQEKDEEETDKQLDDIQDENEPTESKAKAKNDLVVENVDNESTDN